MYQTTSFSIFALNYSILFQDRKQKNRKVNKLSKVDYYLKHNTLLVMGDTQIFKRTGQRSLYCKISNLWSKNNKKILRNWCIEFKKIVIVVDISICACYFEVWNIDIAWSHHPIESFLWRLRITMKCLTLIINKSCFDNVRLIYDGQMRYRITFRARVRNFCKLVHSWLCTAHKNEATLTAFAGTALFIYSTIDTDSDTEDVHRHTLAAVVARDALR